MSDRRFIRSVCWLAASLCLARAPLAAAMDLTGVYRTEIDITLLPDPVVCALTFTQTGGTLNGTGSCGPLAGLALAGTINGFGLFAVTGAVPFICPTLQINGLALQNGASFSGFYSCPGAPVPLAGTISGSRCGNALPDVGETCDDGNVTGGDCCSATCRLEANGAACTSDGNSCTTDACNPSGTCLHQNNTVACDDGVDCTSGDTCGGGSCHGAFIPAGSACSDGDPCTTNDSCNVVGTCVPGGGLDCGPCMACNPTAGCTAAGLVPTTCVGPTEPKAQLAIKDVAANDKDKAAWKYLQGGATAASAFGDPRATTSYTLCLYDQSAGSGYDRALLSLAVPAGAGWAQTPTGFKFKSRTGSVRGLVLKAGSAGKSKILVKAQGSGLGLPPLPIDLASPVLVQLQASSGHCWEAEYATATTNTSAQFKSRTGSASGAFIE